MARTGRPPPSAVQLGLASVTRLLISGSPCSDNLFDTDRGDRAVVKEVLDHLPTFWEPSTAIVGALSEYRFA